MAFDASVKLPVKGFGYLVPMTQKSKVLGVIFDSDALEGQSSNGTLRLTAMMGGHQFHSLFGDPDKVSKKELLDTALKALEEHLGVKADLIDSHVSIHKNCIPQYTVGHRERLLEMQSLLQDNPSVGQRLSLIGSSYTGVGVNDCILGARRVAYGITHDPSSVMTGLESVIA
jgi:oxygen-dependent protoporphyrinogen oxidase